MSLVYCVFSVKLFFLEDFEFTFSTALLTRALEVPDTGFVELPTFVPTLLLFTLLNWGLFLYDLGPHFGGDEDCFKSPSRIFCIIYILQARIRIPSIQSAAFQDLSSALHHVHVANRRFDKPLLRRPKKMNCTSSGSSKLNNNNNHNTHTRL